MLAIRLTIDVEVVVKAKAFHSSSISRESALQLYVFMQDREVLVRVQEVFQKTAHALLHLVRHSAGHHPRKPTVKRRMWSKNSAALITVGD